jgi:hypothetical protein
MDPGAKSRCCTHILGFPIDSEVYFLFLGTPSGGVDEYLVRPEPVGAKPSKGFSPTPLFQRSAPGLAPAKVIAFSLPQTEYPSCRGRSVCRGLIL